MRAPHGTELSCKGWQQEAALRMLMNNLDPDVAEDPDHLIVTAPSSARSGRRDAIVTELRGSGTTRPCFPVRHARGVFRTTTDRRES